MYRNRHPHGSYLTRTTNRALLGSLLAAAACSGAPPAGPTDSVGSTEQALLGAACTYSVAGGITTMNLTVGAGEIGYVGKTAGCTVEPCVYANARDVNGNLCVSNSTTGKIAVAGAGVVTDAEKMVFDFTNGLFGLATTATPNMSVALDGPASGAPISTVMVISPTTGSNMAAGSPSAGVNVIDIDTLTTRGASQYADIKIVGATTAGPVTAVAPAFEFNGNGGADVFAGDISSWTSAMPTGWATVAVLTAAGVLSATPASFNMTLSGGPGNDVLGGGAGTNTLIGGAGNDTFLQGANSHAETMLGGDGVDTVDYTARAASVYITPNSDSAIATVTFPGTGTGYVVGDVLTVAGGTPGLMATITVTAIGTAGVVTAGTVAGPSDGYAVANAIALTGGSGTGETVDITAIKANDGALAEGDSIGADVEIMIGGSGNDILNAHAIPAGVGASPPAGAFGPSVVLIGGPGNDQLTGGPGNDDLCGGTGNDTFFDNKGNDNISGGAGLDTADYTTGTAVQVCLSPADATCTGAPAQNGGKFAGTPEVDVINSVALTHVCPSATLYISQAAGFASVAPTTPGGAMAVDVENVSGNPAAANTLHCGALACVVFGGSAVDTIVGSPLVDQIFGLGGSDNVTTNGGDDLVDLTHSTGAAAADLVNCGGNAVTVLVSGGDTLNAGGSAPAPADLLSCSLANLP